jgi:hypothetical protein
MSRRADFGRQDRAFNPTWLALKIAAGESAFLD